MKRIRLVISIGLLFIITSTALAQSGSGYDLTWNVIAGGGDTSTGGGYTLMGTIGQSDAGALNSGEYILSGGFWSDITSVTANYRVFLPMILR